MPSAGLWAVFTLIAAGAQTLRNAAQRDLTGVLGAVGAAQVRFVFGLPFALLFLIGVRLATGLAMPALGQASLVAASIGAMAQILATTLMLLAMGRANFVVVTAYLKTEAIQVAIFAAVFLREPLTLSLCAAIALTSAGVALMSGPGAGAQQPGGWRSAGLGLFAAAAFAIAALSFRSAILSVNTPSYVLAASLILVAGLAVQSLVLLLYMGLADRAGMFAILRVWRASLFAGFMGALASQFWFLAFALASAARVRTLALVEILFAQIIARRAFRQSLTGREWAGLGLIIVGVAALLNG